MAYPTDSGVAYTPKTDLVDAIQASDVNNLQTETSAVKTLLGTIGSVVSGTFYFIVSEITGTDKAVGKTATQTLSNKTLTAPTITGATITTSTVNGVTIQTAGSATDFLAANGTYQTGAVANASTTVKGIVEAATSAEITAGTATGATGAVLTVTPDALAASTPVFNGSGLTSISKFLTSVTTDTTFTNSSAENTLLTYALAGGTLSTNKGVRVRGLVDFAVSAANINCTFRIKYGGTTLSSFGVSGVTATPTFTSTFCFDFMLFGAGTTGTQESNNMYTQTGTTFSPVAGADKGSSSIDSTTSQNITITAQMDTASASGTSAIRNCIISTIV